MTNNKSKKRKKTHCLRRRNKKKQLDNFLVFVVLAGASTVKKIYN